MEKIEQLKAELDDLANKDFMLEMIDKWDESHYKLSDKYHSEINKKIKELEKFNITTEYHLGYDFVFREVN